MNEFDPKSWNAPDEAFDPRCEPLEQAIDAALDHTAQRDVPEGLSQRVAAASLPHLVRGRLDTPPRLRLVPNVARLAMAACVVLAVLAAFWVAGRQPDTMQPDRSLARVNASGSVAPHFRADPLARVRSLQAINDLNWQDAIGDLESVVWAVQNGAASWMVLSPGDTPMQAVENELDSVRVVTRLEG
jgi:hypothetical protein